MRTPEFYKQMTLSITDIVASHYGLERTDLLGKNRHRPYTPARQMVWKMVRELYPDFTLILLGEIYNRSHATILQGIKSISDQIDTDRELRGDYICLIAICAKIDEKEPLTEPQNEYERRISEILECSNLVDMKLKLREILFLMKNNLL